MDFPHKTRCVTGWNSDSLDRPSQVSCDGEQEILPANHYSTQCFPENADCFNFSIQIPHVLSTFSVTHCKWAQVTMVMSKLRLTGMRPLLSWGTCVHWRGTWRQAVKNSTHRLIGFHSISNSKESLCKGDPGGPEKIGSSDSLRKFGEDTWW